MDSLFKKLLAITLTLVSIQIIGQVVFNFNFYTIVVKEAKDVIGVIKPGSNPINKIKTSSSGCSSKPLHNSSFPIDIISKDSFCIKFTGYSIVDNVLEIDFDVTNNGSDRKLWVEDITLGDDLGDRYDGNVQLITYVSEFRKEYNRYIYSPSDNMAMFNGVTIKGKIYVPGIPKEASQIVQFEFCWGHNKLREEPSYCEEYRRFALPERKWSN